MRKLAIAAISLSAGIFAANYLVPYGLLAAVSAAAAILAALTALRREKWLMPIVLSLILFSAGLLYYSLYYRNTAARAETISGRTLTLSARLLTYPVEYDGYCRAEIQITEGEAPRVKALLYDSSMSIAGAVPGQTLTLTGRATAANTYYGEAYDGNYAKNIFLKINTALPTVREGGYSLRCVPVYINRRISGIIEDIFPADTAAFMKSLLIGDRSDYYSDPSMKAAFTRSGLSHIIAISGMHIAFFVSFIHMLLGRSRKSALLCMALVWLYALSAGASPSAVRAAIMQSMLLLAPIVYRENDALTSLSAALAVILLNNPFAARSVSLQMSFAAMLGIITLGERLRGLALSALPDKYINMPPGKLMGIAAMSLAAAAYTAPLCAVHFGYFPVVSIFSNILAISLTPLCFGGGIAACALSFIAPLGRAAAWCAAWLARLIIYIAHFAAKLPLAVVYTQTRYSILWLIGVYVMFILFAFVKKPLWFRLAVPCLVSAVSLALLVGSVKRDYTYGKSSFTALDVGQGQCTVMMSGDSTLVVDCGSSSGFDAGGTAGAYLLSCGRQRINALALTHLHDDHVNGVPMLLELIPVDMIILPDNAHESREAYCEIEKCALAHNTEIVKISTDSTLHLGNIKLYTYVTGLADEDNEDGLVFRLCLDEFDALITGDASARTEKLLMNTRDIGDIELLVVGHHGSAYSSEESFLRHIDGEHAVISAGYNFYGHPEPETLERLEACGYNIYRTDNIGTIEFRIG